MPPNQVLARVACGVDSYCEFNPNDVLSLSAKAKHKAEMAEKLRAKQEHVRLEREKKRAQQAEVCPVCVHPRHWEVCGSLCHLDVARVGDESADTCGYRKAGVDWNVDRQCSRERKVFIVLRCTVQARAAKQKEIERRKAARIVAKQKRLQQMKVGSQGFI